MGFRDSVTSFHKLLNIILADSALETSLSGLYKVESNYYIQIKSA